RFAYLSPFLKQSKAAAWDYLRAAMAPLRAVGASTHETELRVDYINGGQGRLYGAGNADALRGLYLAGGGVAETPAIDPRVWSEIIRPALADRQGWRSSSAPPRAAMPSSSCGGARSRNRIGFPSCSRQARPASFPKASSRSPSAISARTNMRKSSNARSTPRSLAPTTAS